MKIRLTVELDIPDNCSEWSDAELYQLIFDTYVHYVTLSHLEDTLTWLVESQQNPENISTRKLYEYHKDWADIAGKASNNFTIERI